MAELEQIGKKDVLWGYAATIFTVGAGVLLLPFMLHKLPDETIGIWNIFQTITWLVLILDFGFRPSFSRNISYIFSGVQGFDREGVSNAGGAVNYSLLKGTIRAMQRFYRWMALGMLLLLATAGTAYFWFILQKYSGDRQDALLAWVLLILINCYNLYTYYYDALLQGKGYMKQSQQIAVLGQACYLVTAIGLIQAGLGLTAIVSAQVLNTVVKRVLAYRIFYSADMKRQLAAVEAADSRPIMQAITPNAVKVGLTGLGGFAVNKSAMLMGGAFLSLKEMACYGITLQVMDIMGRMGTMAYQIYTPRLAQCRAERDMQSLGHYYRLNVLTLIGAYLLGGVAWCLLGNWALRLIGSQTLFVGTGMLVAMLVISLLEQNHVTAAGFIQADNRIPFFIPSLLSGAGTLVLLVVFVVWLHAGVWGLILAPGLAQLAYQNWKWPMEVIREIRNNK